MTYREDNEWDGYGGAGEDNAPDYDEVATYAPPRQVEMPAPPRGSSDDDEDEGRPKTLAEQLDSSLDLTDMQFAVSKLFPDSLSTPREIANSVMIGRIAPEVFLPLMHLMATDEVMRSSPHKPIDVVPIYAKNYVQLSVGLDGMGRIDIAEAVGAAREQRRDESRMGGLPY